MKTAISITLLFLTSAALAGGPPILVDPSTGKYLGTLSNNPYDPNSVSNQFGKYGSKFSPDSINNEFGRYGSRFSNSSPNNPYATQAPIIIHQED